MSGTLRILTISPEEGISLRNYSSSLSKIYSHRLRDLTEVFKMWVRGYRKTKQQNKWSDILVGSRGHSGRSKTEKVPSMGNVLPAEH